MCGRLNVTDDPAVLALCEHLGINLATAAMHFRRYIGAAQSVSIIRQDSAGRRCDSATWWLLLDKTDTGFKPSKYTSFNTRYDKLDVPRSAGYLPFRQQRCIIPAKGFGESEFKQGKRVHCHDMTATDGAIAFGGLYREWIHQDTGESVFSCSIITLPPNPKLANIHSKSIPLMLPQDPNTLDAWLDPNFQNTQAFATLLQPKLRHTLTVQQIAKPSDWQATIGDPFVISAD